MHCGFMVGSAGTGSAWHDYLRAQSVFNCSGQCHVEFSRTALIHEESPKDALSLGFKRSGTKFVELI